MEFLKADTLITLPWKTPPKELQMCIGTDQGIPSSWSFLTKNNTSQLKFSSSFSLAV